MCKLQFANPAELSSLIIIKDCHSDRDVNNVSRSWYLGAEARRSSPSNLNITFIPRNEPVRTKESPLFGRLLSFHSRELFTKWIAALLVAEFDSDLSAPPSLVSIQ